RIEHAVELNTLSIFVICADSARLSEMFPSFLRLNVSCNFEITDAREPRDVPLLTYSVYRGCFKRNAFLKYANYEGSTFTQREIDHFRQFFQDHLHLQQVSIREVRETVAFALCKNVMGVNPRIFVDGKK
ncbi:hypothetical protein PFISCL1PPCAC_21644, partial [Pristionchus fissidentatus]